jgi:catechol 2,3-dioxygenase-like lactoylglutathione lyase family enzyme
MLRTGIATVYVSDMDRAVTYYTDTLGFKLKLRVGNDWAEVDAGGGFGIGLHPHHGGGHTPSPGTPGSISIGFEVNEPLDKVVATLKSRGVKFHGPIVDDDPVRLAFFGDPDGNALYLCETKQY